MSHLIEIETIDEDVVSQISFDSTEEEEEEFIPDAMFEGEFIIEGASNLDTESQEESESWDESILEQKKNKRSVRIIEEPEIIKSVNKRRRSINNILRECLIENENRLIPDYYTLICLNVYSFVYGISLSIFIFYILNSQDQLISRNRFSGILIFCITIGSVVAEFLRPKTRATMTTGMKYFYISTLLSLIGLFCTYRASGKKHIVPYLLALLVSACAFKLFLNSCNFLTSKVLRSKGKIRALIFNNVNFYLGILSGIALIYIGEFYNFNSTSLYYALMMLLVTLGCCVTRFGTKNYTLRKTDLSELSFIYVNEQPPPYDDTFNFIKENINLIISRIFFDTLNSCFIYSPIFIKNILNVEENTVKFNFGVYAVLQVIIICITSNIISQKLIKQEQLDDKLMIHICISMSMILYLVLILILIYQELLMAYITYIFLAISIWAGLAYGMYSGYEVAFFSHLQTLPINNYRIFITMREISKCLMPFLMTIVLPTICFSNYCLPGNKYWFITYFSISVIFSVVSLVFSIFHQS